MNIKRNVLSLVAVASLQLSLYSSPPKVTFAAVPQQQPTIIPAEKLGVDLGGVNDRGQEFVDLAMTLRPWQKLTADDCPPFDHACPLVEIDEAGWPRTDARTVFFDVRPFGAWWSLDQAQCPLCADGTYQMDMRGRYKLRFNGMATMSTEGGATVENQLYNLATNMTTADIVVGSGQGLLLLNFIDTIRVPGADTGSGITNVRLVRPGYSLDTTETWTPQILKAVEPFGILRFMNWTGGNNINPYFGETDNTIDWSEHNRPNQLQTQKDGVAWENVINFANRAQKDIWINVPIHATDDYIRGLANLLKQRLRPQSRIYIEYSNEVWNGIFKQHDWNKAAAKAEVDSGQITNLNVGNSQDEDQWARRRYVRRLVTISETFADIFGPNKINDRIRVVVAWQVVQPDQYRDMLDWVKSNYKDPQQLFYGVAGATYFNVPTSLSATTSVTQVFALLNASSNITVTKWRRDLAQVATRYALKVLTYEGGPDTAGPLQWERNTNLLNTMIQAHRDPRMKDAIVHDLRDNWYSDSNVRGDVFVYFTLQSPYNRWGMWGLTEDISKLNTPKYQAIKALRGLP